MAYMLSPLQSCATSGSDKPQDYRWRVYRLKKTPAALVGRVSAPDEETAIKKAIEEFRITDPSKQARLYAGRSANGGPSRSVNRRGRIMRDPTEHREYAEECRRLARKMPEHREVLLSMADAWIAWAEATEKNTTEGKSAA